MKVTTEIQISVTLEDELSNDQFEKLFNSDYGKLNEMFSKVLKERIINTLNLTTEKSVIDHNIVIKNFVRD